MVVQKKYILSVVLFIGLPIISCEVSDNKIKLNIKNIRSIVVPTNILPIQTSPKNTGDVVAYNSNGHFYTVRHIGPITSVAKAKL